MKDYNERDGLVTLKRKSTCGYGYITLIGTVCVVSVIAVFLIVGNNAPDSTRNILRAESPENGTFEAEQNPLQDEITFMPTTTQETPTTTRDTFAFIRRLINGRNNRSSTSNPTVRTSLGRVEGVRLTSRQGREYFGFYNVPYAEKPINELRFQPPVPVKPWNGTLNATVKGTMCVQRSRYNPNVTVEGSEDCLHVNLFTPRIPRLFRRASYPVIAYFFGGGFMHGTANDFSAEYFMDEDVVIVVVESRVGALGYLNTGDSLATGNQGLKDQVQALRWIQDNIADFGGDPARVVAFGTSSGAMCAHAHLLSPMSSGLISGVMSFSGTMLIPGGNAFSTNPRPLAQQLGRSLNCTNVESSEELLKCLRAAPFEDIALNQPDFSPSLEAIPANGNTSSVFFAEHPINIVLNGQANPVPWLVGVNSAEAILQSYSFLLNDTAVTSLNSNFDQLMQSILALPTDTEENQITATDAITDIKDFYFNNSQAQLNKDSELRFNLTNLLGDRFYYHPTHVAGLAHAEVNSVYWYYLTKEANVSFADDVTQYFDPPYGVSHADEVQYVFFRPRYPYIATDSEYFEFSKMFVKYIVAFAADGVPSNPDFPETEWLPLDPTSNGTVWFNLDDLPMEIEPFTERMDYWDSLPLSFLYNYDSTNITEM